MRKKKWIKTKKIPCAICLKPDKKMKNIRKTNYLCEVDWNNLTGNEQEIATKVLISLMGFRVCEQNIPQQYKKYFVVVCDAFGNKKPRRTPK